MPNEPVAMRGDFDGFGYQYIDNGSGSDWQTRKPGWEPLYRKPAPMSVDERQLMISAHTVTVGTGDRIYLVGSLITAIERHYGIVK